MFLLANINNAYLQVANASIALAMNIQQAGTSSQFGGFQANLQISAKITETENKASNSYGTGSKIQARNDITFKASQDIMQKGSIVTSDQGILPMTPGAT